MTQTVAPPAVPVGVSPNGKLPRVPHLTHPPRRVLALVLIALIVGVSVVVWLLRPSTSGALSASGTVEAEEVILAAQAPGRIAELNVDEGAPVAEGQLVGRLSDPVLDVQARQSVADAAQQQVSQAQLQKMELHAPLGGVVQKRLVHKGEVVASGTPILTVADPRNLKLTLFVFEADLGRVFIGQTVTVRADGFGDRQFAGQVTTIATQAEFTPRNIQTQRDRQNLVFAVTVRLPNPDGALKAGLPVDATFISPSES